MQKINIPVDVPKNKQSEYEKNFKNLTGGNGKLLLIAGDQRVEHLNDDFVGPKISPDDASPEHLFKIAARTKNSAFATHLGFISQYGKDYKTIPYIVKINGKSNLGPNEEKNSSKPWWKVEDIIQFKKDSGLKIAGIGYTVYLGGKYESEMLKEAAKATFKAHQAGLLSIIWMYPRAKGLNEENIHTIAGGAGVAAAIGADFVKIKYPYGAKNKKEAAEKFKEAIAAAGRTRVICVGGSKRNDKELLDFLEMQMKISGASGLAIGRNLHQRDLKDAVSLANQIRHVMDK